MASSTTTTRGDGSGTIGARGVGDRYFPDAGNGGYDVAHYDLDLTWLGDDAELRGETEVSAKASQDLTQFDLDLVGFEVTDVTVDGRLAAFERDGRELIITPAEPLQGGDTFTTVVTYAGRPTTVEEGTDIFDPGWQIDDREAFVVSEPTGASTFFPSNDHPSDKATVSVHVTAPSDQTVAANGGLVERVPVDDRNTRWSYRSDDPMATYLVQVAIGDLELIDVGVVEGVRVRHALHRSMLEEGRRAVARTGEMLQFLTGVFGPYPFDHYGVVTVRPPLGFALETQTLTLVSGDILGDPEGNQTLLLHELAHQWVGDAVTPAAWEDVWLNEGFATYAEWLWTEEQGGPAPALTARAVRNPALDVPAGDPGPDELFADTVYQRGALTLQALREAIGDDAFFEVLERWISEHNGTSVRTEDFIALAEEVSGDDLSVLFRAWLDNAELPSLG